ncbi:MAG: hypothetical protein GY820_39735 [Gammaproteobacteria bacterium]|nr:hypothetical protein [Gammaproteobacteria bacterium]
MTDAKRDALIIETHTRVKDVHSAVYGNGQPGLVTRVTRVEAAQEGSSIRDHGFRDTRMFWIAAVACAISLAGSVAGWTGRSADVRQPPTATSARENLATAPLMPSSPMPFGKYKGQPMSDVPVGYFRWLWRNGLDADTSNPVHNYISEHVSNSGGSKK